MSDRRLQRIELLVEDLDRGALPGEDLLERIGWEHDDGIEVTVGEPSVVYGHPPFA